MKKLIIGLMLLWLCMPTVAIASDAESFKTDLFAQLELDEIEGYLDEILPEQKISFKEMIEQLISGETTLSFQSLWKMVSEQFFYEFQNSKETIVQILMIVITAAIFHNFSEVFQNGQVSELSFYVLYVLLLTISMSAFRVLVQSAASGIERLTGFLQLLGPVYFLTVSFSTGSITSIVFYNILLFLIYLVKVLVLQVILPFVQIYFIMRLLDELSKETYLSKLAELLHTLIVWSMRTLLAAIVGLNFVQSMISPAIDSVKRTAITRGSEAIPVVGDAIGGAAELFWSTAVLIKNGVGAAGAFICIAIGLSPVIQMLVICLLYQMIAAFLQPISDKRMINCISGIADSASLLLRIIIMTGALFLITIAMVATTTS